MSSHLLPSDLGRGESDWTTSTRWLLVESGGWTSYARPSLSAVVVTFVRVPFDSDSVPQKKKRNRTDTNYPILSLFESKERERNALYLTQQQQLKKRGKLGRCISSKSNGPYPTMYRISRTTHTSRTLSEICERYIFAVKYIWSS